MVLLAHKMLAEYMDAGVRRHTAELQHQVCVVSVTATGARCVDVVVIVVVVVDNTHLGNLQRRGLDNREAAAGEGFTKLQPAKAVDANVKAAFFAAVDIGVALLFFSFFF